MSTKGGLSKTKPSSKSQVVPQSMDIKSKSLKNNDALIGSKRKSAEPVLSVPSAKGKDKGSKKFVKPESESEEEKEEEEEDFEEFEDDEEDFDEDLYDYDEDEDAFDGLEFEDDEDEDGEMNDGDSDNDDNDAITEAQLKAEIRNAAKLKKQVEEKLKASKEEKKSSKTEQKKDKKNDTKEKAKEEDEEPMQDLKRLKTLSGEKKSKKPRRSASEARRKGDNSKRGQSKRRRTYVNPQRGVILVSRVPHGFYEQQMREFFSQFGEITRLRLSRNKKTGKSKHFAFVEFKEREVATIVAHTMDGYMMFDRTLRVKYLTPNMIHPMALKGANTKFKVIPWTRHHRGVLHQERSEEQVKKINKRLLAKEDKLRNKLKALGYNYDFAGYSGKDVSYEGEKKTKKADSKTEEKKGAGKKEGGKKAESTTTPVVPPTGKKANEGKGKTEAMTDGPKGTKKDSGKKDEEKKIEKKEDKKSAVSATPATKEKSTDTKKKGGNESIPTKSASSEKVEVKKASTKDSKEKASSIKAKTAAPMTSTSASTAVKSSKKR